MKEPLTDQQIKKRKKNLLIGFAVFVLLISGLIYISSSGEERPPTRQEKINELFSVFDGSHRNLEKIIIDNLNDPDSYEHIETQYNDNDTSLVIQTTYTAKNALGGTVKKVIVAESDTLGNIIRIISE